MLNNRTTAFIGIIEDGFFYFTLVDVDFSGPVKKTGKDKLPKRSINIHHEFLKRLGTYIPYATKVFP
jgi:hypothetical protein